MRQLTTERIDLRTPATRRLALAAAVVASAVAVLEVLKPVHVDLPTASAGIETAIAGIAVVAAGLLAARFKHGRRLRDLLLLGALVAVAVTDLGFSGVPALAGSRTAAPRTSAQLFMEVVITIAFTAAAFAPRTKVTDRVRRPVAVAGISGIGIGLVAGALETIAGPGLVGSPLRHSQLATGVHDPVAIAICSSALLTAAGIAFFSRADRDDANAGLLGGASFLLAAARLQSVAMPVVAADWITPDDGLRLAAYAMLLIAALRALVQARRVAALEAVTAERLRIARDLHDGLAQDLALISLHAQSLQSELGAEHPLAIAARHALVVSRGAIGDLSASGAPTLAAAVRQVAAELADRFQVRVSVEIQPDGPTTASIDCDPGHREQVVRIAREAIVNATRHGRAREINVALECHGSSLRLTVSDDGCGIPDGLPQSPDGFGLPTMRSRAQSLGGRLTVRPRSHGGTEVELLVP